MKWPTQQLNEVADFRLGKMLDEKKNRGDLMPYLANVNVRWGEFDLSELREMRFEDHEVDTFGLRHGDIVMCEGGEPGRCAIWKEQLPGMMIQKAIHRIRPHACLNHEFLYYTFLYMGKTGRFSALFTGATIKHLPREKLALLEVAVPPLPVQKSIGSLLSAYDDLIENNRRRMALLEESARLLYQEWFVRLRFPGHEHVRITNGVPEGWKCKTFSEVAEFRLGKMLDQNKNKGDLMPYLANVNVRWGEFELNDLREMRFEDHELETFGLKYGDIVMCEGGEPGRCAIWKEQMPGMMIQKAIHRIRARDNMHHVYLYYSLRHQGQSGHLATLFTGATIKHLPREKLEKVTVVVPPTNLMDIFIEQASPIEGQLQLLEATNRRASEARDLLLPRLMNGETTL